MNTSPRRRTLLSGFVPALCSTRPPTKIHASTTAVRSTAPDWISSRQAT
ncbi:MAG: hypothetical protein U1F20_00295 [Lysobacterales bacterium]